MPPLIKWPWTLCSPPGVLLAALVAGIVGSMFGLGGGIIIIPALTLVLGIDMKDAIGASLIGVIASSTRSGHPVRGRRAGQHFAWA